MLHTFIHQQLLSASPQKKRLKFICKSKNFISLSLLFGVFGEESSKQRHTTHTMTCILSCSHGVVIATAMVFSSTALFLAISRQFSGNQTSDLQDQQLLRSCLSSKEKKKQGKKKKKVKFAENVKEPKGNGEEYRKKREEHVLRRIVPKQMIKPEKTGSVCRNDMPANRIALYNGILRDRDHRVQCSY